MYMKWLYREHIEIVLLERKPVTQSSMRQRSSGVTYIDCFKIFSWSQVISAVSTVGMISHGLNMYEIMRANVVWFMIGS